MGREVSDLRSGATGAAFVFHRAAAFVSPVAAAWQLWGSGPGKRHVAEPARQHDALRARRNFRVQRSRGCRSRGVRCPRQIHFDQSRPAHSAREPAAAAHSTHWTVRSRCAWLQSGDAHGSRSRVDREVDARRIPRRSVTGATALRQRHRQRRYSGAERRRAARARVRYFRSRRQSLRLAQVFGGDGFAGPPARIAAFARHRSAARLVVRKRTADR